MSYYVFNFVSEAYRLQEYTTFDGNISTTGELDSKVHYMNYIQGMKGVIGEKQYQQSMVVPIQKICMSVSLCCGSERCSLYTQKCLK